MLADVVTVVAEGVAALATGSLVGALTYMLAELLRPIRDVEPLPPRAVIRVSEHDCLSVRCALRRRRAEDAHLVEVRVLERGTHLVKVAWPRAFHHLDAWVPLSVVVEDLVDPRSAAATFERWLSELRLEPRGEPALPADVAHDTEPVP
jgi:hypothetical protein